MPQTSPEAASRSNYQSIFDDALEAYQRKTGKDLTRDPLLRTLESCNTPDAVLSILRGQIVEHSKSHSSSDKLTTWLIPTVKVINAFSETISGAFALAYPPAGVIFTGIGVLLSAVEGVGDSQDKLLDLFTRIENIFRRLETHIEAPLSAGMTDAILEVMVEVLCVLAIMTKETKQNRAKTFLKKMVGRKDLDDALRKLENVTLEESRMTGAETLKAVHGIDNKVGGVEGMLQGVADLLQGVDDRVKDIGNKVINVVGENGRRTENHLDTVAVEDPEGIGDRAVLSAVKDVGSRDVTSDGFEKMTPQRASDDLNWDQSSQKFAGWPSLPDPFMNYNIARHSQHRGTSVWFIESSTFREWKQTGCLLWIQGKPGSGKSVLASAIIQDIERVSNRGLAHLTYFFFDFKDPRKQDVHAFLFSIVIQLSSQCTSFSNILLEFYSAHQRGSQQPSDSALIECLEKMLKVPRKVPIYVIVDALDECPDTSGLQSPREKVLALVEEIVGLRLQNLRLCVTSRPEIDIRNVLEPLTLPSGRISLHDEDGHKKDIADYISSVVYSDKEIMRWKEKDKELVVKMLSEKEGGMFRWVSCQFDALRRCREPSVSHVLEELPETLDETYERILQEIPKANRVHAHRLLQCLAAAARPLRVLELAEVLAVDFNEAGGNPKLNKNCRWNDQEQAVLAACSSLIVVVNFRDSRIVQFSHHSVKEFLSSDRLAAANVDALRYHHIRLEPAHAIMAQACVGVLLRLTQPINNETIKTFPLADYAAKHFADHAEFGNVASQITNAIDELLDEDKPHFTAWMSHISSSWWAEKNTGLFKSSALYHVADLGFYGLVQHLVLKRPQDVIVRGGIYGTPMHAALRRRQLQVFGLMLPHCFDMGIRDSNGQTLLHVAVGNGLFEAAGSIIERGADVNVQDNNGWTLLHQIINTYPQFDHRNLEIMRFLLDHGADVEAQDNEHVTPLGRTARNGQLAAAQLLVEHGATVDKKDKSCSTPLHDASSHGYPDIIRLLLKHGADIEAANDEHNTPLHVAALQGKVAVAQILIENGAILQAQGSNEGTPLHHASYVGSLDMIRFLLDHGADMEATDDGRNTPLHVAALRGKVAAAQMLLEHGAILYAQGSNDGTPLHHASFVGSVNMTRLLLEHSADIEAMDDGNNTPLHVAALQGKLAAAQLLIEHGANVHARGYLGSTPLHYAACGGNLNIMRLLLDHKADADAQNTTYDTPIHIAVTEEKLGATRMLLAHGANVLAQNKARQTPLQLALGKENKEIKDLLCAFMQSGRV